MIDPKRIVELWDRPPFGLVNGQGFHLMTGPQAHEVAVGPVHAGVIEPGHFRFQCLGEDVRNLEISLGYQHRGAERLIVEAESDVRRLAIAQTVAGDTSVAATLACSAALQTGKEGQTCFAGMNAVWRLLLELERIANHVGDLGALAGDVAYLPTASFCGRIRGEYLNMTALFTGNRFGRVLSPADLPSVGSPAYEAKMDRFMPWFLRTRRECLHALDLLFSESSAVERFEGTGVVSEADARAVGMVGVAARASGVTDTMGGWPVVGGGDVLARARQRYEEIREAHARIERLLVSLPGRTTGEGDAESLPCQNEDPDSIFSEGRDSSAPGTDAALRVHELPQEDGSLVRIAIVDAWRGELVHAARFVPSGSESDGPGASLRLADYRVFDPSYFNWFGLSLALRGEQISNFPICNKSFNLSYCGVDR